MYSDGKIIRLDEIAVLQSKTLANKRSVLVGGCFDLFHYGHHHFLSHAKQHGDTLIVLLESDTFIEKVKSKKPVHTQTQRAEILAALTYVDFIVLLPVMHDPNKEYQQIVHDIQPKVIAYSIGDKAFEKKKSIAETIGAKLIEINYLATFSSSQLITYATILGD